MEEGAPEMCVLLSFFLEFFQVSGAASVSQFDKVDFEVPIPAETGAFRGVGTSTEGLNVVVGGGEVLNDHDVRAEFEACGWVDIREDPVGDAVASDARRQGVTGSSI